MVKKLLHTRYRVKDLEKTVSFYKDVLGLEETRRHTSGRGSQLVFLKAPESEEEIELCKFDESGPVVVGPDLTHLASRQSIAAATLPNNPGSLGAWIVDSQHIKPGNKMPPNPISGDDLTALLAYLENLK